MILFYLTICFLVHRAHPHTKIWNYDNDVTNPQNYVKVEGTCKGKIIFPESMESIPSITWAKTGELVLPSNGEIVFQDGAFLDFDNSGPCIEIKDAPPRDWYDPSNWSFGKENSTNRAVPDTEKIPCDYDDVVFPAGTTFHAKYPIEGGSVKSISINKKSLSQEEFQQFLDGYEGLQLRRSQLISDENMLKVTGSSCQDFGCFCFGEKSLVIKDRVCGYLEGRSLDCLDPIQPVGHCGGFCGGMVHLKMAHRKLSEEKMTHEGKTSKMATLLNEVRGVEGLDLYVTKVKDKEEELLQVTFANKDTYSSKSTEAAVNFHRVIKQDLESYGVEKIKLAVAGLPYREHDAASAALAVILGTLFGAVLTFTLLYFVYVGDGAAVFRVFYQRIQPGGAVFARFDNGDGVHFSDLSGSVMGLDKSFENPLFGRGLAGSSHSLQTDFSDLSAESHLMGGVEEVGRDLCEGGEEVGGGKEAEEGWKGVDEDKSAVQRDKEAARGIGVKD